ncbi:uncharacterized protein BDV14DRAFT_191697 [Aspergillus stella-maris]|uniref:uncharacterized protein n=1 Tax=Aspergillus stella-maris TaxID=1810926 RepID=UPI003CCCC72D
MTLYGRVNLWQNLSKSLASIVNDPCRGFLGHLTPSIIKHYPYRGRQQFLIDFQHAVDTNSYTSEWLMVSGVNSEVFDAKFLECQSTPFSAWCAFDSELELLLIRVVNSAPHEVASETFHEILLEVLIPAGMNRKLIKLGSTAHFAVIGGKQADKAWRPLHKPRDRTDNWPSVVLDVAYSETAKKLQGDIRYWLRASGGDVKIALALKIDRRKPMITIEKWDISGNGRKHLEQHIVISRKAGNIIINGEQEIELNEDRLGYLASQIWNVQTFQN